MDRLPGLKNSLGLDFIVVNGENSAGGRGITPKIAIGLLRAGAAVITTGDHIWDQKEVVPFLETEPRLLRPLNYPPGTPGQGSIVLDTEKGRVAVINAQGRTFMQPPLENPFLMVAEEVARLREEEDVRVILLDFHCETTSEKIAMGRYLDGTVSAVIGTHTHVQTADERVFPGGTAFLSDAGMCGPHDSVLGRKIESVIERMLTSTPHSMPVARGPVRLCGALVDVDVSSGNALTINRFCEDIPSD
jgi:metallophosphoesterase (TIGR00282 family)